MNTLFNNTMYNYFKSTNIHKKIQIKKKFLSCGAPPLAGNGWGPWAQCRGP